jgi:hypothetical protein
MVLQFHNIEQASPQLGVILQSIRVTGGPDHFDQAFAAIEASHPQGLVVLYGPLRGNDLPRIVEFVMQRKLPTIFQLGEGVRGGGLMEFGPKNDAMFRRTAAYIDKIANGTDPAILPVEEPSQFELEINLKAAEQMSYSAAAVSGPGCDRRTDPLLNSSVLFAVTPRSVGHRNFAIEPAALFPVARRSLTHSRGERWSGYLKCCMTAMAISPSRNLMGPDQAVSALRITDIPIDAGVRATLCG